MQTSSNLAKGARLVESSSAMKGTGLLPMERPHFILRLRYQALASLERAGNKAVMLGGPREVVMEIKGITPRERKSREEV